MPNVLPAGDPILLAKQKTIGKVKRHLMNVIKLFLGSVLVLVAGAGQAQAGVIYQQGDITGPSNGIGVNDSFFGYDDFTIGSVVTVTDADWWVISDGIPNLTSASWEFRSVAAGNTVGSIVAQGIATPTFLDTGLDWSLNPSLSIYKFSIDIADTPLTAGSYFFGLQLTQQGGSDPYWSFDSDQGTNLSPALQSFGVGVYGLFINSESDLQFQLNGSTAATATVPEPASLAIFGALGLAACGMRRRSSKWTA